MGPRLFLLACLIVAALRSAAPPPRPPMATTMSAASAGDGLPTFADDVVGDHDDGVGDCYSDTDDDALPAPALRLRAETVIERVAPVILALPESAALASLFRPPCRAAV